MLALRCGPRLLGLLPLPRSLPLRLPTARACSGGGGAGNPSSSAGNPLVYLDVGADGQPLGRVVLEVRPWDWAALDWAWGTLLESPEPWPGAMPGFLDGLASHSRARGLSFPFSKKGHWIGFFRYSFGTLEYWGGEGTCRGESSRSHGG